MVSLSGGGAAAPLSIIGRPVLVVPVGAFTVDNSGSLCLCPEVLPAARRRPGECSCMNLISFDPAGVVYLPALLPFKVEPLQKIQQDAVGENRNGHYPW